MGSRRESAFLRLAAKVAEASDCPKRHGAVIVKGGRVLSIGFNRWRNLPEALEKHDRLALLSTHAEVDAIRRAGDPDGATIYIARLNKAGNEMYSAPCKRCLEAIERAGIKKVVFTTGEREGER